MRLRATLGLLLLASAAACGDNAAVSVDAALPVDAAPVTTPSALVVAGTANDEGSISRLDIASLTVMPNIGPGGTAGADPIVRRFDRELFVVNRHDGANLEYDDNIVRFQLDDLALPGVLVNLGHGPQDVAVVGDTVYVPLAGGSGVIDEVLFSQTPKTIDLSADDPDGQPNCMSALAVGSDVYVVCALLDDTQAGKPARGPARVYVIDSATDTVRASLTLTTPYPSSLLESVGDGTLAIATADPKTGAGCIEHITPGPVPVASGCAVRNDQIGGHVTHLVFQPLSGTVFLWMAAAGMAPPNTQQLMAYDFMSGEMWPPISTPGETVADVGLCPDGSLVIADVTPGASGLRVYQLATEVTTAPLSIGTPPSSPHGIACY